MHPSASCVASWLSACAFPRLSTASTSATPSSSRLTSDLCRLQRQGRASQGRPGGRGCALCYITAWISESTCSPGPANSCQLARLVHSHRCSLLLILRKHLRRLVSNAFALACHFEAVQFLSHGKCVLSSFKMSQQVGLPREAEPPVLSLLGFCYSLHTHCVFRDRCCEPAGRCQNCSSGLQTLCKQQKIVDPAWCCL